jgi:hypothetical protein
MTMPEPTAADLENECCTMRGALLADHSRIELLLSRLEEQADAEVRPALEQTWASLERALLSHLEEEEMFLFPELAKDDRLELDDLARDHAEIRTLLGEIGIGIELHTVRAATIRALVAKLRAHAARENAKLYVWAEGSTLPGPETLRARLRRSLDRRRGA